MYPHLVAPCDDVWHSHILPGTHTKLPYKTRSTFVALTSFSTLNNKILLFGSQNVLFAPILHLIRSLKKALFQRGREGTTFPPFRSFPKDGSNLSCTSNGNIPTILAPSFAQDLINQPITFYDSPLRLPWFLILPFHCLLQNLPTPLPINIILDDSINSKNSLFYMPWFMIKLPGTE